MRRRAKWCLGLTGSKRLEEVKNTCTKEKEKGSKLAELWVRVEDGPEVFFLNVESLIFA